MNCFIGEGNEIALDYCGMTLCSQSDLSIDIQNAIILANDVVKLFHDNENQSGFEELVFRSSKCLKSSVKIFYS